MSEQKAGVVGVESCIRSCKEMSGQAGIESVYMVFNIVINHGIGDTFEDQDYHRAVMLEAGRTRQVWLEFDPACIVGKSVGGSWNQTKRITTRYPTHD